MVIFNNYIFYNSYFLYPRLILTCFYFLFESIYISETVHLGYSFC